MAEKLRVIIGNEQREKGIVVQAQEDCEMSEWGPDNPFNHHWQDYHTRKDRSLKTVSDAGYAYQKKGKHTACVKVIDTFGCDTSITVEVDI